MMGYRPEYMVSPTMRIFQFRGASVSRNVTVQFVELNLVATSLWFIWPRNQKTYDMNGRYSV